MLILIDVQYLQMLLLALKRFRMVKITPPPQIPTTHPISPTPASKIPITLPLNAIWKTLLTSTWRDNHIYTHIFYTVTKKFISNQ